MIRRLQRKFIAIVMIALLIVLTLIMGLVNIISYSSINMRADRILDLLIDNGGRFPKPDKQASGGHRPLPPDMSLEIPYETRFFTVILNDHGQVVATDTSQVAAISTSDAVDYAMAANAANRARGFITDYKYAVASVAGGTMLIFVDLVRDLTTFRSFLLTSIIFSLAGMLAVLVLVLILSRFAVRPITESYDKQKRFITDASHEIKTPLTIINANIDVIEMESGESAWTQSIRNQIGRLATLTSHLTALARMDEGQTHLRLTSFSLSDAVLEAADPFVIVARQTDHALHLDVEPHLSFTGDEQLIRQLISILLDNAVKYADRGGQIQLGLHRRGKKIELLTRNPATRVEEANLDLLFERFYRSDLSRNQQGGFGIGLSLARSIVEAHQGKIIARYLADHSIEFSATFPI